MTSSPADPGSLKKRAVKGGAWATVGLSAKHLIRLGSNLIMTRLLMPEAFGLMAIAGALQFWLGMMTDLGIKASIMRSTSGTSSAFLSTAFVTQIGRNALLAVLLSLVAISLPFLARAGVFDPDSVYANPLMPLFLFGSAASMVISGFNALRAALHQRDLRIAPLIQLEIAASVIGIASMIVSALLGVGALSLVVGMIVTVSVSTIGSHVWLKGPVIGFKFDKTHFREIFGYGKWILVSSFFTAIAARGDQFLFGWMLPLDQYAMYAIATVWIIAARSLVEAVLKKITFPIFAELFRERPKAIRRIYGQLRLAVELFAISIFLGIVFFADLAVGILYTDTYTDVSHFMKLLAVSLLFMPYRLLQIALLASGNSRRYFLATAIPAVTLLVGTPIIFTHFGVDAAVVFAAASQSTSVLYNIHVARAFMPINLARELVMLGLAVIAVPLALIYL